MILTYSRNGKTYETDSDKLSPQSAQYLLQYGWAQSLQDSIAGLEKRIEAECLAAYKKANAEVDPNGELFSDNHEQTKATIAAGLEGALLKRSDGILSGTITTRSAREERDPLRSIAIDMVRRAVAKKGIKIDKDKLAELVNKLLETDRSKVENEMQRRKELEIDVEI